MVRAAEPRCSKSCEMKSLSLSLRKTNRRSSPSELRGLVFRSESWAARPLRAAAWHLGFPTARRCSEFCDVLSSCEDFSGGDTSPTSQAVWSTSEHHGDSLGHLPANLRQHRLVRADSTCPFDGMCVRRSMTEMAAREAVLRIRSTLTPPLLGVFTIAVACNIREPDRCSPRDMFSCANRASGTVCIWDSWGGLERVLFHCLGWIRWHSSLESSTL